MNVLHIESSPRGSQSYSRQVAEQLAHTLQTEKGATVVFRDLNHPSVPHVSQEWVDASLYTRFTGAAMTPAEIETLRFSDELVAEVKAADVIVFGVPMYNFGVPSVAKAWFDNIARLGATFAYTATGPVGLLHNKKLIAVSARGGSGYGPGEPYGNANHVDGHVQAFFGWLGITDVTVIPVNNTARGEEAVKQSVEEAQTHIRQIVAGL